MRGLRWGRVRRWLARRICNRFGCCERVYWFKSEEWGNRWKVRCRRCHDWWLIPPCGRCFYCEQAEQAEQEYFNAL